ncbi:MAG: hypothetical protein RL219_1301 [Actinomycetota bacterium]
MNTPTPHDPIRARRAQVAKWVLIANRVGYLFWGASLAVFFIGFGVGFKSAVATTVIATLIAGAVLLAPSIILGYAVKAADKDDRLHGR